MPWVMIVDSSATIAFLAESASATSGEKSRRSTALIALSLSSRAAAVGAGRNYRQSPPGINGGVLRSPIAASQSSHAPGARRRQRLLLSLKTERWYAFASKFDWGIGNARSAPS